MVEQEVVRRMRALAEAGWGHKRIAREVGVARNTVRRYLRAGRAADKQVRPKARRLTEAEQQRAAELWDSTAEGNAVVVQALLAQEGIEASVRTVQRAVETRRRQVHAAQVATVRFETKPGQQMQVDFGEKKVRVGGQVVKVFLLVAVLSFSRRLFVRAFLNQRGDDWREGVAAAFMHFGGVPLEVLSDNARPLVVEHHRPAGTVRFHPAWVEFCRDWDVTPKACGPYRARTKGKTESGVKYVKRNALAGRDFESFDALEAHLAQWMREADERVHGTTHERPLDRFEREEKAALRALPTRVLPRRHQRLVRKVAHDALVDVDTVRYSVPHRLVRERVEVQVGDSQVRIFHAGQLVATHARSREPHGRVIDPAHWEGLWRLRPVETTGATSALAELGRTLGAYAQVVEQAAKRGAA
ncbi:IS21 family transposase [Pyxidicoccus parkwayensis]|uniref:IS21 family transposase n=1 Tax=Pyxidicoccus parkwayensis TaxID=2813578 RepID=A0ABX7PCL3_9BACT|nr:IS21 family transposase [Pyxidicoccus parkwaysis]QSQ28027.1 IS21 family transposase [Pyxidicoccus parkwaysis]QSQ28214.1 IS21 family transposase [Pyxidicoccus parkwaysis]QSQ28381.1 IS21 family transposase [Pyxidicoccus parkwaysis]